MHCDMLDLRRFELDLDYTVENMGHIYTKYRLLNQMYTINHDGYNFIAVLLEGVIKKHKLIVP